MTILYGALKDLTVNPRKLQIQAVIVGISYTPFSFFLSLQTEVS